jgi:hypothetical protein
MAFYVTSYQKFLTEKHLHLVSFSLTVLEHTRSANEQGFAILTWFGVSQEQPRSAVLAFKVINHAMGFSQDFVPSALRCAVNEPFFLVSGKRRSTAGL